MNKISTLFLVLASMAVVSLLTGCQKGGSDPLDGDEVVPCQVQKIIIPSNMLVASNRRVWQFPHRAQNMPYSARVVPNVAPGASDTLIFTYNTLGNPVSVIHQLDVGGENILFNYDKWNRLTEYINIFPNGAGDYWHRYTYDKGNSNRIIADTAFRDFFSSNGVLISFGDIDLTVFKYDAQERISQSTEYVLGDTIVRQFSYDAQGNLQGGGSIYDNKLNIHRTNKIWMFIDRDYSINNPVNNGTDTYNSTGLPTAINTNDASVVPGFEFIVIGYPFAFTKDIINYSCP